jgi:ribonucleoside-triphosphate reductase
VTINLPRIGFLAKSKAEFLARLAVLMELASESLEIKRVKLASVYDILSERY